MRVSAHQPNYLPWGGYFFKLLYSDVFVLLDCVQFHRGRGWINRNRIKTPQGVQWLTVPVKKKGLGLQKINEIEINNSHEWKKKHLFSLYHFYKRSPYFHKYIKMIEEVYEKEWIKLVELNVEIIQKITSILGGETKIIKLSELKIKSKGVKLIIDICSTLSATSYLSGWGGGKYLLPKEFKNKGVKLEHVNFTYTQYPQLWGEFIPNLSIIDILFNCGEYGVKVLFQQQHIKEIKS